MSTKRRFALSICAAKMGLLGVQAISHTPMVLTYDANKPVPEPEAIEQLGTDYALQRWPPQQGYAYHNAIVMEIE